MKASRRQFLTASAGTLASLTLGRSAASDPPSWIDGHVHIWTPDTKRYPIADGHNKQGLRTSFTPEQLFTECRPHGVSRIVLIQMSFYQFNNSYMLDMIQQHAGTFAGVAIIDETAPHLAQRMRSLKDRGIRGFRVYANPTNAANWEQSADMHAMWRQAAANQQSICCLTDPDALPALSRLCQKHPDTPVVIDHFARIGMRGEVNQQHLDALLSLANFKRIVVKTSAFYALGKKTTPYLDLAPMIRQLRDAFGAQRLMWASDCPFQVESGHTYQDSIALIRDRLPFLSQNEKEWMLKKTAEKVFF